MDQHQYPDYLVKIILVGTHNTGKTSLLKRITKNTFSDKSSMATIGVDFETKNIPIRLSNGVTKCIQAQIFDTAGQERFAAVVKQYYRGAHCAFLVYSIDNRESFERLENYLEMLIDAQVSNIYVVGNKNDLISRQVTLEEGLHWATIRDLPHFETSAKSGQNVSLAFDSLLRQVSDQMEENTIKSREDIWKNVPTIKFDSTNDQKLNNQNCC